MSKKKRSKIIKRQQQQQIWGNEGRNQIARNQSQGLVYQLFQTSWSNATLNDFIKMHNWYKLAFLLLMTTLSYLIIKTFIKSACIDKRWFSIIMLVCSYLSISYFTVPIVIFSNKMQTSYDAVLYRFPPLITPCLSLASFNNVAYHTF